MTGNLEYFESRDFKKILNQYEQSVKSGQSIYMDADDLADIADYYQYNNRPDDADQAIQLALKYNPEATGPLLYQARKAMMAGLYDTAREYAEKIKAIENMEAIYLKGEILICEGKSEEADEFFRAQLNDIYPDELMDYVYDVACIFSDYNLFDKAFEWILRSQGDESDDFKELMARTLFGLGKYKDSERIFNELIDHNPYSVKYWNALANAQFMSEDYSASVTSSEYAIAIDPNDAESILSKANGLYNLPNYEEAYTYYKKFCEMMPEEEYGYLYQGTCLVNLDRFEEAVNVLKKGVEVSSKDSQYLPEIYQELAFAYNEIMMPETALYYLDQTLELDCDHINLEIIRGHILLSNKRQKEAEIVFRKALTQSANSPRIMLRIIMSLYDNHYMRASYTLLKSLLCHVDDSWKDGYAYMALCCWEMKKHDEFLKYLKIACDKNLKEVKIVFNGFFPPEISSEDYYSFISKQLSDKKQ